MARFLRKPAFWIILIVSTFLLNIFIAWVTIHNHMNMPSNDVFFLPSFVVDASGDNIPESIVWHRMLQDFPRCHDGLLTQTNNGTSYRSENHTLPPFGFHKNVKRFLEGGTDLAQTCYLPPPTSCRLSRYSVVVISKGKDLRHLFLNLMTFVSYPDVLDITLILDLDLETVTSDDKYGQRLLEWDKQSSVKLITRQQDLWSAIQMAQPHSSAVVWIDGDVEKDWDGTTLKDNFWQWRELSRSLFVSQVSTGGSCGFPKLHRMMMHRYFLCYLDHPVVGPLKRYTGAYGWDATQNAISMLWNHLSDGYTLDSLTPRNNGAKQTFIDEATKNIVDYFGCSCLPQTSIHSNSSSHNHSCSS